MEKLLTVVVPVFKVEQYINKCLESLVVPEDQMERLEVLVINDGTPDNSAIMAKEFEKIYPQTFKVIDKENGGHGSAYNKGLELATGKYIRFLDSDDWFTTEQFSKFLTDLETCDVDMVFTHLNYYYVETDSYRLSPIKSVDFGKTYQVRDFDWVHSDNELGIPLFHFCTYKTALMKPHLPMFVERVFYDDKILRFIPILEAETFTAFDYQIYNYLIGRVGQTISSLNINHIDDSYKVLKECAEYTNQRNLNSQKLANYLNWQYTYLFGEYWGELSSIPYKMSKEKLERLHQLMKSTKGFQSYPKKMKLYENLPFWLYRICCKLISLRYK